MAPQYSNALHASSTGRSKEANLKRLQIPVQDALDGTTSAILHYNEQDIGEDLKGGVILISGAGGGISGPGGIYPTLADTLAKEYSLPTFRLDYRVPASQNPCVNDVNAAISYLAKDPFNIKSFILVGWSFGGSPCFTAAANDLRIKGVATVASQTAGTEGIRKLPPRPLLLMHGSDDTVLSPWCAQRLSESYGSVSGKQEVRYFKGDDHGLTKHSQEVQDLIVKFVRETLEIGDDKGTGKAPDAAEGIDLMEKGGDLKGETL